MGIPHRNRTRGSILVFALLVIIAVLAIGVVLISRAGRESTPAAPAEYSDSIEIPDEPETTSPQNINVETSSSAAEPLSEPVVMPPPPPPAIVTPDPKSLPPEG